MSSSYPWHFYQQQKQPPQQQQQQSQPQKTYTQNTTYSPIVYLSAGPYIKPAGYSSTKPAPPKIVVSVDNENTNISPQYKYVVAQHYSTNAAVNSRPLSRAQPQYQQQPKQQHWAEYTIGKQEPQQVQSHNYYQYKKQHQPQQQQPQQKWPSSTYKVFYIDDTGNVYSPQSRMATATATTKSNCANRLCKQRMLTRQNNFHHLKTDFQQQKQQEKTSFRPVTMNHNNNNNKNKNNNFIYQYQPNKIASPSLSQFAAERAYSPIFAVNSRTPAPRTRAISPLFDVSSLNLAATIDSNNNNNKNNNSATPAPVLDAPTLSEMEKISGNENLKFVTYKVTPEYTYASTAPTVRKPWNFEIPTIAELALSEAA